MKEKIKKLREEVKDYLIKNLDNFEFIEVDTYHVVYKFDDEIIKIWTINGEDNTMFYEGFAGFSYFEYTDEERKLMWNKAQSDKNQEGTKSKIEIKKLGNDLFFSFKGVYKDVKFTGYDDNDWWNMYKPKEIQEDEGIVWKIDLEKMVAIYKENN